MIIRNRDISNRIENALRKKLLNPMRNSIIVHPNDKKAKHIVLNMGIHFVFPIEDTIHAPPNIRYWFQGDEDIWKWDEVAT